MIHGFMAVIILLTGCALGDGDAMDSYRGSGNPLFVAVQATNDVYISTDGRAWIKTSTVQLSDSFSITYGNKVFIIAGEQSSGGDFAISVDGVNWNVSTTQIPTAVFSSITYNSGIYSSGSDTGNNYFSINGINWYQANGNLGLNPIYSICYGGGLFLSLTIDQIQISNDGINWSGNVWSGPSIEPIDTAYGNMVFVTVGLMGGSGFIMVSQDAINWSNNLIDSGAPILYGIAYGNNRFVAVGNSGSVYVSENGFNWMGPITVIGASGNRLQSVIYADNRFVAVGSNGTIIYSKDGYNWSGNVGPGTGNFMDVAYRP